MKPIPLVRISAILPTMLSLQQAGAPIHRYLRQAQIPGQVIDNPEVPIPLATAIDFCHLSAKAEGLDSLGLAFVKNYQAYNLGMFGQILQQSFTLHETLQQFCTLANKTCTGQPFWLQEEPEQIWFCQRYDSQFYRPAFFKQGVYGASHYSLAVMLSLVRRFLGQNWQPSEVYVTTPPFRNFEHQFQLEDCRLYFNRPHNAIRIPRRVLATGAGSPMRSPLLSSQHIEAWQATAPALDFVGTLEQTLETLLLDSCPSIEYTAAALGMSIRSLQRHLSKDGISYSRLIDKVRYQKAIALMQDAEVPLIEVAYSLGYSDPANFSHAFKRWTGVSPRQFLQNQKVAS
jgi:AraC-like DNA-binding protein